MTSFALSVALAATQAFYLFAPLLGGAAISGLVLRFDWLPWLKRPIDCGATFRGMRVFGASKTWRGVVVAVAGSIVMVAGQQTFADAVPSCLQVVDYHDVNPLCFGGAMGAGAMIGELPNSFVKRQLGIAPGGTTGGWRAVIFYVWDQVDLLTGAWPLLAWWLRPSALLVVVSFPVVLAVHPLVALVGYLIGARKSPR